MASAKYIFVTGGVTSSLGKGIVAASLGNLLKARGYRVTIQKFDPYINIDPGTLNPYEHGECYVTDDGAETDLDLGHYERFLNVRTSQNNNVTTVEDSNQSFWWKTILFPYILKIIVTLLTLFTAFVTIVQSTEIIDLVKDFTALFIMRATVLF